jgi:hypothetical protein
VAGIGLALGLCGCGSGASHNGSSKSAPATSSTAASTSSAAAAPVSSSGSASSGGTTPPGTKLATGTSALVNYKPGTEANSPTYRLRVAVLSIQRAPQADFDGVELEKAQRNQTPYYVKLSVRNEGSGDVGADEGDPTVGFQAFDERGAQVQELTLLGRFRPCESATTPKPFGKGVTEQSCVVYMVGKGGSVAQVRWTGAGGEAYSENPIVWTAG